jgi:starch-binding outer membrane protein, SusD/RagB family
VASGIQARLIETEAALNGGQGTAYLTTLNTLRASVGLAALTDPGTPTGRIDQFFSERAMWLFGTATRLGDMRRMVRQYNRPAAQVFPSGPYTRPGRTTPDSPTGEYVERGDGNYGTAVNFPITIDELNNPRFTQ